MKQVQEMLLSECLPRVILNMCNKKIFVMIIKHNIKQDWLSKYVIN